MLLFIASCLFPEPDGDLVLHVEFSADAKQAAMS